MAINLPVVANLGAPIAVVLTDGNGNAVSLTNGSVPVNSTATLVGNTSKVSSGAYTASLPVKSTAGTLFGIAGFSSLASAQFILIFDTVSLPADGAVPDFIIMVPATGNFSVDFSTYGRKMVNGISICNSSTGPTKTIGAANTWFDARYL